jgi:hypothetical protein
VSLTLYREVVGGRFKAKIGVGIGWWSIEVQSTDGDVSMSFKATCRTVKTCMWIHNMFLTYVNTVALLVENPGLAAEVMAFVQNLYRSVTEEEMAEILGKQACETECN